MPDDLPHVPRGLQPDFKKNRPKDSPWRQQTLPAYRPLLDARCALPITSIAGIVFAIFGYFLYHASDSGSAAMEMIVDYTECKVNGTQEIASDLLSKGLYDQNVTCQYTVELQRGFTGDVYFYYGLSHFYQNTRQYVRSRNDLQLTGQLHMVEDCHPYDTTTDDQNNTVPIAPCGAIANSLFNDTFNLTYWTMVDEKEVQTPVPFTTEGVVWRSEREKKYINPPCPPGGGLKDAFNGTGKPPNWQKPIWDLVDQDGYAGFENTDFIVWMNPAALPTFRKLYRMLDRSKAQFADGLPAGNYTLIIGYNYPIAAFGGTKRFIIATESWAGPKNYFLGIAYMTFGLFLILISCLLLAILGGLMIKAKLHRT